MENTQKKVAKPGLQLVISILVVTILFLAELYVMINQPANVILVVGIAVLVLIAVYFVIDAVVDCQKQREIIVKEQYDNLYRSERATYKLLKKKMEEFSDIIQEANQNNPVDNSEELINSQKKYAKLSISKNRESAEMITEKIAQLENVLENSLDSIKISGIDEEKQDRLFIELNNLEASLNDRLQGLSDKLSGFQEEIERLAEHIANINNEAIQTALNTASMVQPAVEQEKEIILEEENALGMSAFADESLSDIEIPDVNDDFVESDDDVLSQLLETESSISEDEIDALAELAKAVDSEPAPAPVEEKKPTPALAPADNGGKMGQDDIAALIASMTGGDAEPAPAPVEEKKPTPPPAPADNGGKMNQDDIAALIASMTGN